MSAAFSSPAYWEARYAAGGTSGAGSAGRLASYKAAFINAFASANGVASVADFGCGDGAQLALFDLPGYLGLDVSPTALARCAAAARRPDARFATFENAGADIAADLCLSLDVIYHLVEDRVFEAYLCRLFAAARRFVIVYASNVEMAWAAPHVRHRRFTDRIAGDCPGWRLLAHVPNPRGFDPARPEETSFADFYVFARAGAGGTIVIPPG